VEGSSPCGFLSVETVRYNYFQDIIFSDLFTYLLTAWSRGVLEKLTGSQLVKKFPTLYGTRISITSYFI